MLSRLQETVGIVARAPGRLRRHRRRPRDPGVRRRALQLVRAALAPALLGRRSDRVLRRCATCLVTVAQLLAPFCPFIADEIYDNLVGAEPSVHLSDFPVAGERDAELEAAMAVARETVRLGLAARGQAKLKIRQPLRAAVVVATGRERDAIERLAEIVREELNVRELRFVSEADELGQVEIKPNYRTLGPRFGKDMPMVAAAVAGLDAGHAAATLRDGGTGRDQRRRRRARAGRRRTC